MTLKIARWVREADNQNAKVKAAAIKRAKIKLVSIIIFSYPSLTRDGLENLDKSEAGLK